MRVISNKSLMQFSALHADADSPLQAWRKIIETNLIANTNEMKRCINAVDIVGEYHVFNIGGNKYRLIAFIKYSAQLCYIKHVLTHKEYDKGAWK
ncbi:type II toxin-antitoxin system HigB family toxin [Glaciimonas sp. GG7]